MIEEQKGASLIGIMSKIVCLTAWIIGLNLIVLMQLGLLKGAQSMFVIDAQEVARLFLEDQSDALTDDELAAAILIFDQLVMEEAASLHQDSGIVLVNKAHVLAGATDVSAPFAARVLARWESLDVQ